MEVELFVRAKDLDHSGELWVMGEDIELEAALDEKLEDIVEMILDRHQLRFPEGTMDKLHTSRFDIVVPPDHKVDKKQYHYQLRRIGLTVKDNVLEIRPTMMGVWMWHPMDFYVDQFKDLLTDLIGDKQLSVAELVELVKGKKPPVLRTSTKVFMRMSATRSATAPSRPRSPRPTAGARRARPTASPCSRSAPPGRASPSRPSRPSAARTRSRSPSRRRRR
jgi:hypothetical protein